MNATASKNFAASMRSAVCGSHRVQQYRDDADFRLMPVIGRLAYTVDVHPAYHGACRLAYRRAFMISASSSHTSSVIMV